MRKVYADKASWPKAGGDPWHSKLDAHQSMIQLHYTASDYLSFLDHIRLLWNGGSLRKHGNDCSEYQREEILKMMNRHAKASWPPPSDDPVTSERISDQNIETREELRQISEKALAINLKENLNDRTRIEHVLISSRNKIRRFLPSNVRGDPRRHLAIRQRFRRFVQPRRHLREQAVCRA